MAKMVTLTIDDREVNVPAGTLIVDAAKTVGIDIPVFCYHPKMEPVGMCRMCLVDIGRPAIDRATGQVQKNDDGTVKISFGPKLETACTTPVSEGMVVRGMTEKVKAARKDVIEFLLTSHPLDCPICDKGGECPLQNLTMAHGSGLSRFQFDEKMRLAKHLPLGSLIYLDRERCIQCARCIRFQDEIVDDPVIGFYSRGRSLEIVTYSDPGFNSYFSGNTTDICPVGALTTADFRFEARAWELNTAASICTQCPVGCNLTLNLRRETAAGGKTVIKRIMPRQNEAVNEIWICDKGRFGYHYAQSDARLTQPLIRQGSELVPTSWDIALQKVADEFRRAGKSLVTLVGGRLANEDLFNLSELTHAQGGQAFLYSSMAGGDLVARYSPPAGSNLKDVGKGAAILVVASDLIEEAPIWWLRIKQAVDRGATLIVASPRETRLERYAAHALRYPYGDEAGLVADLLPGASGPRAGSEAIHAAAQAIAGATSLLVIYGHDGQSLASSAALASACAQLLHETGQAGKANSGLLAAWQHCNDQGAWDMGLRPTPELASELAQAGALLIAAADPAGDDPDLAHAIDTAGFVVVQELFLTDTARKADVVLPVQPFSEREGSYTNGERRVQRFYPGMTGRTQARADFQIAAQLGKHLGHDVEGRSVSLVMRRIAASLPDYAQVTYERLAEVIAQDPIIGRKDLYYGGTGYDNHQGLGIKLNPAPAPAFDGPLGTGDGQAASLPHIPPGDLLAIPVDRLYDCGTTFAPSAFLLKDRLTPPLVVLRPEDAERFGVARGGQAQAVINGITAPVQVAIDASLPAGTALVPRSVGLPIPQPVAIHVVKGNA
jgi:NADH-quinone oxidoreductase subunit G